MPLRIRAVLGPVAVAGLVTGCSDGDRAPGRNSIAGPVVTREGSGMQAPAFEQHTRLVFRAVPRPPATARVGVEYSHSFCQPPGRGSATQCGSVGEHASPPAGADPAGGSPPYTFGTRGFPPAGLRLSSGGVLSGFPQNPGERRTFQVCVRDSRGAAQCRSITLDGGFDGPGSAPSRGLPRRGRCRARSSSGSRASRSP